MHKTWKKSYNLEKFDDSFAKILKNMGNFGHFFYQFVSTNSVPLHFTIAPNTVKMKELTVEKKTNMPAGPFPSRTW